MTENLHFQIYPTSVRSMWKEELAILLQRSFERAKARNPRASVRGVAQKIGISHSTLLDILKGELKWKPSEKLGEKILKNLDIEEHERDRIRALMGTVRPRARKPFSGERYLLDWRYMAILFAFDLGDGTLNRAELARKYCMTQEQIAEFLEELLIDGVIKKNRAGEYRRNGDYWSSTDEIPSTVVRMSHTLSLDLGKRALQAVPTAERDFTSLTFAGNSQKIGIIKTEIRKFHEKCEALMASPGENDQVFRLSVQLFPFDFGEARK